MGNIRITNQYSDHILWAAPAACPYLLNNGVDVWRININDSLPFVDNFLTIMNTGEIARTNRYLYATDKNRAIITRGSLRFLLGKYLNKKPSSLLFEVAKNNKPYLKNESGSALHYNISHSGNWVILAVADKEVGVDIEYINPQFDYQDILTDNFSEDEISFIMENPEHFFTLWTRKEALTKATGIGLDDHLKFIPALTGEHFAKGNILATANNWIVNSFKVDSEYVASLAVNPLTSGLRFWDVDFK